MTTPHTLRITAATLACLFSGCLTKIDIVDLDAGPREGKPDHSDDYPGAENGVSRGTCTRGGDCDFLEVTRTDKLDLLLVVDNTASMQSEQAALAAQLPQLLEALNSGLRTPNDPRPFLPPRDIHLGVISSDLGLPGVDSVALCDSAGGDGARFQSKPQGMLCDQAYPAFLSFQAEFGDLQKVEDAFACIAPIGTAGCSFRQPLEAALKALWPAQYFDGEGKLVEPNPIEFLSINPGGKQGIGDLPSDDGGNKGFLRNDPNSGLSLLSLLVVTNSDDCSMRNTDSFRTGALTASGKAVPDVNLRCFHNKPVLYDTVRRYAEVLPKLRPGRPDLVTFSAIAGVPTDLVDASARALLDMRDESMRNAYYDAILNDARMKETVDPTTQPGTGTGDMNPSCIRAGRNEQPELAFPPRRIVEVAKGFGTNGVIQSICSDLELTLPPIIDNMAAHFGGDCLAKPLKREANDKVACDVIWQLPKSQLLADFVPTECDQLPFAHEASGSRRATNDQGGKNCVIDQAAVSGDGASAEDGWYYDDFSDEAKRQCQRDAIRRIAFSAAAKPMAGVRVVLDCSARARD